jgi:branched-chain amino acid transport system ATP-binding protein
MLLEIKNVSAAYGAVQALRDVSISVAEGEVVCLVGANGAGKSSLINVCSGIVRPWHGKVYLDGMSMDDVPPEAVVSHGIVQVPEGRQVFASLTVSENLELGAYWRQSDGDIKVDTNRVYELFPRLAERRNQQAGLMSGGEQQMLAIGRALMAKPRILLLDEPSMGLAPLIVANIFETLLRLNRESGLTILLVEQNARAAMKLSHRAYMLATGRVVQSGTAKEMMASLGSQTAFIGTFPNEIPAVTSSSTSLVGRSTV